MIANIKKILRPYYWNLYSSLHKLKSETPIFVVGCAHSGTTLMLRILYEHEALYAIGYESSVIGENYVNYPLLVDWVKATRNASKLKWVEKTPDQIRYLDKIFSIFPKAKVIVMVRDGRDVTLSLKNRGGDLKEHMERWIQDNNAWLKYQNDTRVIPVKLENFVESSKEELAKICENVGISYNDSLLEYHNKKFNYSSTAAIKTDGKGDNHQSNRNWQVNQKIFKSTSRWEKEAKPHDLILFNKNIEFINLLKRFKYIKGETK